MTQTTTMTRKTTINKYSYGDFFFVAIVAEYVCIKKSFVFLFLFIFFLLLCYEIIAIKNNTEIAKERKKKQKTFFFMKN